MRLTTKESPPAIATDPLGPVTTLRPIPPRWSQKMGQSATLVTKDFPLGNQVESLSPVEVAIPIGVVAQKQLPQEMTVRWQIVSYPARHFVT